MYVDVYVYMNSIGTVFLFSLGLPFTKCELSFMPEE